MKVNRVLSGAGCEQWTDALFKKRWLQKEPLARALRILGHPDMVLVPERLDRVGNILDRNVRQFGRAQTALHRLFQIFLALIWRVVVVERFPFDGQMTRVLDGDVAFERAVLVQAQGRNAGFPGLVGRRQWRLYPDGRIIGNQGIDTFFLPAQHPRRDVMKPGIEKFPGVADANRDVRGTKRAGNYHVSIKESLAPVRRQGQVRVKAGGVRERRKQEIDIDCRTDATLESISRLLVLFQLSDFFPGKARALVTGVLDVRATEGKNLLQLLFRCSGAGNYLSRLALYFIVNFQIRLRHAMQLIRRYLVAGEEREEVLVLDHRPRPDIVFRGHERLFAKCRHLRDGGELEPVLLFLKFRPRHIEWTHVK